MKKSNFLAMSLGLLALFSSCSKTSSMEENPFLTAYTTEYEIPPFDQIKYEHYIPAIEAGIKEHNEEIDAIIKNRAMPDFNNTILALDNAGATLNRVSAVLYALSESDGTPEMQKVTEEAMPMLTAHSDEVGMNALLFDRIKQVYDRRDVFGLNTAQMRLLEKTYKTFVRKGALLDADQQEELKKINQEISAASLSFNNNLLEDTNSREVLVENEAELAGLPENVVANAAETAKERGKEGKWVFTVHAPSRLAVLTYADNRGLRERMYNEYTSLCSRGDKFDNSANINKLVALRTRKAQLLGFESFAAFQMDNVMSKTVENAENLLYQIWTPAIAKVQEEVADMQTYADAHGADFKIAPWDYYYYAEKVRAEKYAFNEDLVRPYFKLENVVKNGIFEMAKRLYGITFTEMPDAPKYNPEVTVYDVKNAEGKHVAVFMTDYFPRATKRQGAWMSEFKGECNYDSVNERPIIYNVGNFTRPSKNLPSLLSLDEVETTFHEFGHALQGMLTTAQYRGQAGTNVDRDFVELPSQINEHWMLEPELLKNYALHYETGEVIPDSLVQKIIAADKFNMGFMTTELVGAALLDIEWHKFAADGKEINVKDFEKSVAERLHLPAEVQFRYRSPYFKHIFGDDQYAAGYYTYLWAEVLEADGYELFREKGAFNREAADAYRTNILEPGDSEDPMVLYERFRGHKPSVEPLLRNRGLK